MMDYTTTYNLHEEIKASQREFSLTEEEILYAIKMALKISLKRDIVVDENEIIRLNKNGTTKTVTPSAYKKSKKELKRILNEMSFCKHCEKISKLFKKHDLVEGEILDSTLNGYFIACKGQKAFCSTKECKEKLQIGSRYFFEVTNISKEKIFLSRISLKVVDNLIQAIVKRSLKLRLKNNRLIVYCDKPYLEDTQMQILRSSLPYYVMTFKKIKEN